MTSACICRLSFSIDELDEQYLLELPKGRIAARSVPDGLMTVWQASLVLRMRMIDNSTQAELLIGTDVKIVGIIQYEGTVLLNGTVRGEVRCAELLVSADGLIEGVIVAEVVCVAGQVDGEIYANELTLTSTCEVEGEIFHRKLTLDKGCYFEGKSRRYENPLQMAPAR